MKWKDTTGYSQNRERIPTTWTLQFAELSVTVTYSHIYFKGEWIASCEPFFLHRQLYVNTAEEAQEKAFRMVKQSLAKVLSTLSEMEVQDALAGNDK